MAQSIVTNEDCMELMARYPDKYFGLAVIDPEYGIGEDGRKSASRSGFVKQKNGTKLYVKSNHKPKQWDKERVSKQVIDEIMRVSRNQIFWGANHYADLLPPSSGWIIWDKVNHGSDQSDCELAWTSFKRGARLFRFMWAGMLQGSRGNGLIPEGNKKLYEKRIHPTQKPIPLYTWTLQNYAQAGDIILDTHLGSGSHRIAADELGFDFVACEKDLDYFTDEETRFKNHIAQTKLFA